MNLIWFLLRSSWLNVAIAGVAGSISGVCSAALIASINTAIRASDPELSQLFLRFLGLVVAALATNLISQFLLSGLSYEAVYKLRLQLSNWILACPLRHLEEQGSNRILATLTEDTNAIADTIAVVPFLCIDFAIVVSCLVYLCWLSWSVFLVTAGLLVGAMICIQLLVATAYGLLERAREEQDRLFKHFRAITDGIKELKLNVQRRQAFVAENLQRTAAASRRYDTTSMRILGVSLGVSQLLFFVIAGFLVFGLPRFTSVDVTVLSAYILVVTYLTDPLQRILQILPGLSRGSVALQKIEKLGLAIASRSEEILAQPTTLNFRKQICLVDVCYTYQQESGENFTLGPINLMFHPGELVFIIGGNGSGKSTLAKLITGLYVPQAGEILWDEQPVTDKNREQYRQLFSTVFSDFYLFEQLLGIAPDLLDTKAQNYLEQFQLNQKVKIDGDRFSTIELSQGQRKRLALLTAYLEDRPIYLFDEWAADQDPSFREKFYNHLLLELKRQGKTVLTITHDDRYFHLADRVIKLDYGKLV
jgi:putative pyoverdin transport system ATP-binding/permease protein